MNSGSFVHWSRLGSGGEIIACGQMPAKDLEVCLQQLRAKAMSLLEADGTDHVLYGCKVFNRDGELESVEFYMRPMSDADFEKHVSCVPDRLIFAVHKMVMPLHPAVSSGLTRNGGDMICGM